MKRGLEPSGPAISAGGMDESLRFGSGEGAAVEADGAGSDGKPIGFSSVKGRFRRTAAAC